MQRIVVLNAKGGSGKTTLATNLAACYASRGFCPALLDYDVQGSSMNWLGLRSKNYPVIHGLNAVKRDTTMTRSWQMRLPVDVDRVIIDTPSAATGSKLGEYVRQASIIVIPVLPSPIDIHAVINFLKEILLLGKMRTIVAANDDKHRSTRIGIVANRVQDNTQVYKPLQKFLSGLDIPFVTALQDSHYYSHAFVEGIGVHELRDERMHSVLKQWQPLITWIEDSSHYPSQPSITSRQQLEEKYNI